MLPGETLTQQNCMHHLRPLTMTPHFDSWDYGMTDGHELWKMTMYAYKAAGLANLKVDRDQPAYRPAFFPIHQSAGHTMVAKYMQELGMTTLGFNNQFMQDSITAAVPDMFGKSEQEIEKIPPYIQYFKCEDKFEKGDPGCGAHKYNATLCENRKYRAR
jgi:hypothetical protein